MSSVSKLTTTGSPVTVTVRHSNVPSYKASAQMTDGTKQHPTTQVPGWLTVAWPLEYKCYF